MRTYTGLLHKTLSISYIYRNIYIIDTLSKQTILNFSRPRPTQFSLKKKITIRFYTENASVTRFCSPFKLSYRSARKCDKFLIRQVKIYLQNVLTLIQPPIVFEMAHRRKRSNLSHRVRSSNFIPEKFRLSPLRARIKAVVEPKGWLHSWLHSHYCRDGFFGGANTIRALASVPQPDLIKTLNA